MHKLSGLFHDYCQHVLDSNANGYAKAYAKAGLGLFESDEMRVQCLYILSNTDHWRGDDARHTKAGFRSLVKELQS